MMALDQSFIEAIARADQLTRLNMVQQVVGELEPPDVQTLSREAESLAGDGNLSEAIGIAEIAVLCAIVAGDKHTLAQSLCGEAKLLFSADENRRGVQCTLQAYNLLRQERMDLGEVRTFFVERALQFGVTVVDSRLALGLDPARAVQTLRQVEEVFEQYGYELGRGYACWARGDALGELLRLEEALVAYARALAILRRHRMLVGELLLSVQSVCIGLNQLDEAERYLAEAERAFGEEQNELGLAAVLVNRAALRRRRRQFSKLVRMYRQAREIYQRHGQARDAAFVEMNVGTLLQVYPSHAEQSLAFLESALATFERENLARPAGKAGTYLAQVYAIEGNAERAEELLAKVLESDHGQLQPDAVWSACHVAAQLASRSGDLEKAYHLYQQGLSVVDSLRGNLRTEEFFTDALALRPDFHTPLVGLALQLGKTVEALDWVEQAKSRALLQLLGNQVLGNVLRPHPTDERTALLRQIESLDSQIATVGAAIAEQSDKESVEVIARWEEVRQSAIRERERLRRRMKMIDAETASMVFVQPLDWGEIQGLLPDEIPRASEQ